MNYKLLGLTPLSWIVLIVMAIVIALNNIYSTLLTGWGDGGSIIAVVLCLIFLGKSSSTIITYNLGQTLVSAGGSVGFTTSILAAIYYTDPSWSPNLYSLSLLIMCLSLLGVIIAIPLRKYVVRWFFPSAVACATILKAVTSEDKKEGKRARNILLGSGIVSSLLTFPTKVALSKGATALWGKLAITKQIVLSLDPLLYGIGMVVGPRIATSMLVGAVGMTFFLVPELMESGHKKEIGDYVKWIAVGFMTLPAFSAMFFQSRYKSPQELPVIFKDVEDKAGPWKSTDLIIHSIVGVVALVGAVLLMDSLFHVHVGYVMMGIVIGAPLCVMLGKVASTTDINPVRLLAIILLFIFSFFGIKSPVALLGIGIAGAALASIAVDLFYDLRTGYLVGANPKHQISVQYVGVIVVAFASVFFLDMLATDYGFGEGKYFPAPGAKVWSAMAVAFSKGGQNLSSGVWIATGIASAFGILLSFLESHPKTSKFTPSPFAIGIAMLLPFEMSGAIFIGGIARFLAVYFAKKRDRRALVQSSVDTFEEERRNDIFLAGSAVFAAAALTGTLAVILISFGFFHLPAAH